MKNIIGLFVLVALIAVGCNKDQKVIKKLEGDWSVSGQSVDGVAVADSVYASDNYHFVKCKVKDGPCSGTWTTNDVSKGSTDYTFDYAISDKGTKIKMNIYDPWFGLLIQTQDGDIIEASSSVFKYEYTVTDTDTTSGTTSTYVVATELAKK